MANLVAGAEWQRSMQSKSGTVVCCFLGMSSSQDLAAYRELLSLLRPLALSVCCELSISTHQRRDGAQEVTIRTALPMAQVSVIAARIERRYRGFTVAVRNVQPPVVTNTKPSIATRLSLRVNHGH